MRRFFLFLCASLSMPPSRAQAPPTGPTTDPIRDRHGEILHRRLPSAPSMPLLAVPKLTPRRDGGALPAAIERADGLILRPALPTNDAQPTLHTATGIQRPEHAPPEAALSDPDPSPEPGPPAAPEAETPTAPEPEAPPRPTEDPRDLFQGGAALDSDTEREGELHYYDLFEPSIVPLKRVKSLDTVTPDGDLILSPSPAHPIPILGNHPRANHDLFTASVHMQGQAGVPIPLPSISPESAILSYEVSPLQDLTFSQDAAGNFYLTPTLDGPFALAYVMDAPLHWFGRPMPTDATLEQIPPALRPQVPFSVKRQALSLATHIGLSQTTRYDLALDRLVRWFRAFEPGELDPHDTPLLEAITLGQLGICRHRSHAFVVIAQSLGIPARYTFNEAHVFVEVYIPSPPAGWLAIDLGGGAEALHIHADTPRTRHQASVKDPFARPPAFENQGAAGARVEYGMAPLPTPDQAPSLIPHDPLPADAPTNAPEPEASLPTQLLRPWLPPTVPTPTAQTQATRTTLELPAPSAYRGDQLQLQGRVDNLSDPTQPPDGLVTLTLDPTEGPPLTLGTAPLQDGAFRLEPRLPPNLPTGPYRLRAHFLGGERFAPSASP